MATTSFVKSVRAKLLHWYDTHKRDLPWRKTRDPYAIWVSEIMLQQTQVKTVVPYYERFIRRFPSLRSLAEAEEDDVMPYWSGLGYYRRARLLHSGVREVIAKYGGDVPKQPDVRQALPGIGRYTAGAIGSIAFDQPEPIVDGNIKRVLSRLYGIATPLGTTKTERLLWYYAETLVHGPRPGDLNQALMELGATVCTKRNPACTTCPVAKECNALATQRVEVLPVAARRATPKSERLVSVAILLPQNQRSPHVLLVRGDGSRFGALWGLPTMQGSGRSTAKLLTRNCAKKVCLEAESVRQIRHVLSHRELTVELWRATCKRESVFVPGQFVSINKVDDLGVSRLTKKLLESALSPQLMLQNAT